MRTRSFNIDSNFYCVLCGNKGVPIARIRGRENGHLKKLYCLHCQKETNHAEVKEFSSNYSYNDFIFEKDNGNFDKEGNRILTYSAFRDKMHKEGVKLP